MSPLDHWSAVDVQLRNSMLVLFISLLYFTPFSKVKAHNHMYN